MIIHFQLSLFRCGFNAPWPGFLRLWLAPLTIISNYWLWKTGGTGLHLCLPLQWLINKPLGMDNWRISHFHQTWWFTCPSNMVIYHCQVRLSESNNRWGKNTMTGPIWDTLYIFEAKKVTIPICMASLGRKKKPVCSSQRRLSAFYYQPSNVDRANILHYIYIYIIRVFFWLHAPCFFIRGWFFLHILAPFLQIFIAVHG